MERHSCLNHAEVTERAGLEFCLHILCKCVSFFISFITDCKGRHVATVLDRRFRAVSVTESEVSFKMRTVTLQTATRVESELILRLQLQALYSLGQSLRHLNTSRSLRKPITVCEWYLREPASCHSRNHPHGGNRIKTHFPCLAPHVQNHIEISLWQVASNRLCRQENLIRDCSMEFQCLLYGHNFYKFLINFTF
jgi:hypothetical protein